MANAISLIKRENLVENGDNIVITSGVPLGEPGSTNMLNVLRIGSIIGKGMSLVRKRLTAPVCRAETPEKAIAEISGDKILVIKKSTKEYIPALEKAGAIITEENGLTSHAGVISLNRGVPCVTGVAGIMDEVEDGMVITVDGIPGLVYAGRAY